VHRDALASLVVELTHSGLDYYFMKQLKLAKPGFVVEQSGVDPLSRTVTG
jgi:hypothetical protein